MSDGEASGDSHHSGDESHNSDEGSKNSEDETVRSCTKICSLILRLTILVYLFPF